MDRETDRKTDGRTERVAQVDINGAVTIEVNNVLQTVSIC